MEGVFSEAVATCMPTKGKKHLCLASLAQRSKSFRNAYNAPRKNPRKHVLNKKNVAQALLRNDPRSLITTTLSPAHELILLFLTLLELVQISFVEMAPWKQRLTAVSVAIEMCCLRLARQANQSSAVV